MEQSSPSEHIPSPQQPRQLLAAYSTQYSSHCTLQQNMSCAQTQASTSLTEQPGVSPSSQHSPPHVPHVSASSAHSWLQESDSQHSGWVSQTHSATSKSLHALVVFAIQHEPLHPPQSVGQLRQSSPFSPSQIPFPQNVSHCPSTHCWLPSHAQSAQQFAQFSPSPQTLSPQQPTHSSCASTAH